MKGQIKCDPREKIMNSETTQIIYTLSTNQRRDKQIYPEKNTIEHPPLTK